MDKQNRLNRREREERRAYFQPNQCQALRRLGFPQGQTNYLWVKQKLKNQPHVEYWDLYRRNEHDISSFGDSHGYNRWISAVPKCNILAQGLLVNARYVPIQIAVRIPFKQYWFTFGCGQPHANHYVIIEARDNATARKEMFGLYGTKWSMMYDTAEAAGVDRFNLIQLKTI